MRVLPQDHRSSALPEAVHSGGHGDSLVGSAASEPLFEDCLLSCIRCQAVEQRVT